MKLGMFVPTRGRPDNAVRLARAVNETSNHRLTRLLFVIDHDDPERDRYVAEVERHAPWAGLVPVPPDGPRRMGPVLNWAVDRWGPAFEFTGFMGDDHLPRTPRWDERLCASLGGRPGVAYGNDLLQGERLPTAVVVSASVVSALGYLSPPPLVHLFLDDFWKRLGTDLGNLRYSPDVVIEHLHPAAGKAAFDQGYAESGLNAELMRDDGWRYRQWLEHQWPDELKRLREAMAES